MAEFREYGVETTVNFPLIDFGATDYETTPVVHAVGDTQVMKDEAPFGNTTNGFVYEGSGIYSMTLTALEMQAARVVVTIIDQTGPKAWEDQSVIIDTYGNAAAQHAFNLNVALTATTVADATLSLDMASVAAPAARSLLNAVRFLRNRWRILGGTLTVYEEDDATPAWTSVITTSATDPVSESDPA